MSRPKKVRPTSKPITLDEAIELLKKAVAALLKKLGREE